MLIKKWFGTKSHNFCRCDWRSSTKNIGRWIWFYLKYRQIYVEIIRASFFANNKKYPTNLWTKLSLLTSFPSFELPKVLIQIYSCRTTGRGFEANLHEKGNLGFFFAKFSNCLSAVDYTGNDAVNCVKKEVHTTKFRMRHVF